MNIIKKEANLSGAYPAPQSWGSITPPTGYAVIPDSVNMSVFYAYSGFVFLTIEGDTVTGYTANIEAWEAWKASLPDPTEEEPSEEEDTSAMLIDHEYRLTLLELGLSEF